MLVLSVLSLSFEYPISQKMLLILIFFLSCSECSMPMSIHFALFFLFICRTSRSLQSIRMMSNTLKSTNFRSNFFISEFKHFDLVEFCFCARLAPIRVVSAFIYTLRYVARIRGPNSVKMFILPLRFPFSQFACELNAVETVKRFSICKCIYLFFLFTWSRME